jgi:hypothetical protein
MRFIAKISIRALARVIAGVAGAAGGILARLD